MPIRDFVYECVVSAAGLDPLLAWERNASDGRHLPLSLKYVICYQCYQVRLCLS